MTPGANANYLEACLTPKKSEVTYNETTKIINDNTLSIDISGMLLESNIHMA